MKASHQKFPDGPWVLWYPYAFPQDTHELQVSFNFKYKVTELAFQQTVLSGYYLGCTKRVVWLQTTKRGTSYSIYA